MNNKYFRTTIMQCGHTFNQKLLQKIRTKTFCFAKSRIIIVHRGMTNNLRPFFSQFILTELVAEWYESWRCDHSEAEQPTIFYEC
jgi:hypothetical protein